MINNKYILAFLVLSCFICSCTKGDMESPSVVVSVSSQNVKIGEPVEFVIEHNALVGSIYTGDKGHNYSLSADFLLAGKTEEDIKNNIYRPVDHDIKKVSFDLSTAKPGDDIICGDSVGVIDNNTQVSLINQEAKVVFDIETQKSVLEVDLQHPDYWSQALKFKIGSKIGENKTFSLRMKYEFPYIVDLTTGEQFPDLNQIPVIVNLSGYGVGDDTPTFNTATVWDLFTSPSLEYHDFQIDLADIITEWEKNAGKVMEKLDYVTIRFVSSTVNGTNVGYRGKYYVESASFGDFSYFPFDTGVALNVSDATGILKYEYTYNEPGEYEAVIIGTNISWKKFSGDGYIHVRGENLNANEYDYCNQYVRIPIIVSE